jgi:hypothetical protein
MTRLDLVKTIIGQNPPVNGLPGSLTCRNSTHGVEVILQSKLRDGRNWFNMTLVQEADSDKSIEFSWSSLCRMHERDIQREGGK